MPHTVRDVLNTAVFRSIDVEELLDPDRPTYVKFDAELGYVPAEVVMRDGMDHTYTTYTYEPGGQRKMLSYRNRPCRINTYGDSFTQCQQVSDGETWQERLAAHIGEPIRNFGVGGCGTYQAFRRAMRNEATDAAAENVILNIFDDDHLRNIDSARWIRIAWKQKTLPPDRTWPLHGLPWSHVRFDLEQGRFVELPGLCRAEEDLWNLCDPDRFYQVFKDDAITRLFALTTGGAAEVQDLEELAGAFGLKVDLRDPTRRAQDATKLHVTYGLRSTEYTLDLVRQWASEHKKRLMILLSYGEGSIEAFLERQERFDQSLVDYLEQNDVLYVDGLLKAGEDYKKYNLSCRDYLALHYIQPEEAAVCEHYNPMANLAYAFSIKDEVVHWLDPKPPAYRD